MEQRYIQLPFTCALLNCLLKSPQADLAYNKCPSQGILLGVEVIWKTNCRKVSGFFNVERNLVETWFPPPERIYIRSSWSLNENQWCPGLLIKYNEFQCCVLDEGKFRVVRCVGSIMLTERH